MNEQIRRIKQKDYSSIDQTLFQNLSRTDNLSSTLSHLSQFQNFLLEQINFMNNNNKQKNCLKHSIARQFNTLKQSLVKGSRIKQIKNNHKVQQLKIQISKLKSQLAFIKDIVRKERKQFLCLIQDISKKIEHNNQQFKQQNQKKIRQILNQNRIIREQNTQLLKYNQTLINKLQSFNQNKSTWKMFNIQTQQSQYQSNKEILSILKNKNENISQIVGDSWKISRRPEGSQKSAIIDVQQAKQNNKSCLVPQHQNSILSKKGVDLRRNSKSKQKIKIFSIY